MSGGSADLVKGEERDGTHTHHKKKPMKKNTKSNQSSVPVQHSHTTDTAGAKPDNRERTGNLSPIDIEERKKNRTLPTQTVVERLAAIPTAAQCATIVGKWVWVQFAEQPAAEVRQQLAQLGFHWNRERQAWQHPCGAFSLAARTHDPRDTYASKPAVEAYA